MLRARGEHQRHLSHRGQAGGRGVQDNVADFFPSWRATGFARNDDGDSPRSQGFGQFLDLRALAGAVEAFEGDELATVGNGHVGDDKSGSELSALGSRGCGSSSSR